MADEAVVVELAPLPREQMGPFLILGVYKDADSATIDAHWAQRVIWARKKQFPISLPDVNWAREELSDPQRRVCADVSSLNVDTADQVLRKLEDQFNLRSGPGWQPIEAEKDVQNYTPNIPIPDPEEILARLQPPADEWHIPLAGYLLQKIASSPLDPWDLPGIASE